LARNYTPHNTRATEQLRILNDHYDFRGKSILDLGCGYADVLSMIKDARLTCGVDQEIYNQSFKIIKDDLNSLSGPIMLSFWDVIICFSVLPYLSNPDDTLRWIWDNSKVAFIECQYSGDGPGFDHIRDDHDMENWLKKTWERVEPIGKTLVVDREMYRTIWRCQ